MSAEAELARRRAVDAERQRRWRERHGRARQEAFVAVRTAHLDVWRDLCSAERELLVDGEGSHLVYQRARPVLIEMFRDEYEAALRQAEGT